MNMNIIILKLKSNIHYITLLNIINNKKGDYPNYQTISSRFKYLLLKN